MDLFIVTDIHDGHAMMVEKGHRPEGYSQTFIENWQRVVPPTATVIDLGDVMMGHNQKERLPALLKQLPCAHHILCVGNHDRRKWSEYYDAGFALVCTSIRIKDIVFSHYPMIPLPDGEVRWSIHGHFHGGGSNHRSQEYEENTYYRENRHRYALLEIESTLSPVRLEDFLATLK